MVHPTARLENSLVRGPAIIGPRARLRDAYVGPYTSIGADVVMEGAEIEHSIVFSGAELRYVGARLESERDRPGRACEPVVPDSLRSTSVHR